MAIVSGKQNEDLENQGKLLAGSRVEIAQVGFTVFVKKGAANGAFAAHDKGANPVAACANGAIPIRLQPPNPYSRSRAMPRQRFKIRQPLETPT